METISEILDFIPEEKKSEVESFFNSEIEKEKQHGISTYSKKDKEVLKYKNVLKDLGYDNEKYDNVDTFKESLKETVGNVEQSNITLSELNTKFENLNTIYQQEVSTRMDKEKELETSAIRTELNTAIKGKLYGDEAIIENVILKNELSMVEGKILDKDGNDFDTFAKTLLEVNKDSLRATQKAGLDNKVKKNSIPPSEDSFVNKLKQRMNS